ncbi:MAG: hypothetical protein K1060chlam5_00517 [Candidatus Anoxychlamydiales bacterium]|nr:hypothetical protein [Candidatus Anoxychlamydiales bacterium]
MKKNKLILTSILIGIFLIIIIFAKPTLCFCVSSFLKFKAKTTLKSDLKYDSLKIKNHKIVLENVSLHSKNRKTFDSILVEIDFKLNFKNFSFKKDIFVSNPNIFIYKSNEKKTLNTSSFNNKLFSYKLNVENGSLNFIDQKNVKTIYFNFFQKNEHSSSIEFNFDKNNSFIVNHINEDYKDLYTMDFNDLDIVHLQDILNFYDYKYDLLGTLKGIVSLEVTNKKILSFFTNVDFKNIEFIKKDTNLKGVIDFLHLELNYPDNDLNQSTILSKFLNNKILEMTKIRFNGENLNLISNDLSKLSNTDFNFSFNPNIGSKFKINGILENDEKNIKDNFEMDSKGFITSNFSNWLDINLNFKNNSKIIFKSKQIAKDVFILHTDIDHIKTQNIEIIKNIYEGLNANSKKFSLVNGVISSSIDARVDDLGINKVFLTNLNGENIEFKYGNLHANINSIYGKAQFDFSLKDPLDNFFTDIKINNSTLKFLDSNLKNINIKLQTLDGFFQSSLMNAYLDGIFINLDLKGHIKEFNLISKLEGKLNKLEDRFSSIISCKRKKNSYSYSGNIQISDEQDAVFGFELNEFLLNKNDFAKLIINGWIRAEKINLDKLSKVIDLKENICGICNIAAFFEKDNISFQIKGKDFKYKSPYINVNIDKIGNLKSFVFEENSCIKGSYKDGKITAAFPNFKGNIYLPKYDLLFDIKKAKMNISQNKIFAKIFDATSNLVNMNGDVIFDMSIDDIYKLDISASYFSKIEDFKRFASYFEIKDDFNLYGNVDGNCNISSSFFDNQIDFKWDISSNVKNGEYKINGKSNINNLNFSISYFSEFDKIEVANLNANLNLNNKKYFIKAPYIVKNKDELSLDVRVQNKIFDILRVVSTIHFLQNKYKCSIDEKLSHFYFEKFNVNDLVFLKNFKIDTFSLSNKSSAKNFFSKLSFLIDLGLDDIDLNLDKFLNSKGNISYTISKNKNLSIEVSSDNLDVMNSKINNFNFLAYTKNNVFHVEKCNFYDVESKFNLIFSDKNINISDFILKKDGLKFELEGLYSPHDYKIKTKIKNIKADLKKMHSYLSKNTNLFSKSIEGSIKGNAEALLDFKNEFNYKIDLDLTTTNLTVDKVRLYNRGGLNASFSNNQPLKIQGIDLSFYNKDIDLSSLSLQVSNVQFDFINKSLNIQNGDLRIPKDLTHFFANKNKFFKILDKINLDEDLEISFDFECSDNFSTYKLNSKNLEFFIDKNKFQLKDLSFSNFLDKVFLKFDYLHNKNFYTIDSQLKFNDILKGATTFIDKTSNTPLKVLWSMNEDNNFKIKEIKGSFCGIDASFQEQNNQILQTNLFGSMKLDFSKLFYLLPNNAAEFVDKFKIKNGYELSGKLNLDLDKKPKFNFKGIFAGKNFDLLNFEFKTLFCSVLASDDSINISNFKISDSSGILTVNSMNFINNSSNWEFNIPKIQVRDLRPSLLKKKDQVQAKISPFLIREMTFFDFKGNTSDKNSITAKGYLSFINSFKRGHYVFDFPTDVLSRIVGLDLQLLTPVKGLIDFYVNDSKFYLTEMKDSFSENERSKFFLSDKGQKPYIDFNGNIYINIAMKQFVLFKFTESFIISIRGDLVTPKCNLKKKRGLFN